MARIFISYKRADSGIVTPLKEKIEAAIGEPCWIDIDGIESDAQYVNKIISAINQAQVFIFMYSQCHTQIEDWDADWTIRELTYAIEVKVKHIIILKLDDAPLLQWFRFMFPQKQIIDSHSPAMLDNLICDIREWLNLSSSLVTIDEQKLEKTRTAAEQGDPMAQNQMGIFLEQGLGVQKNKEEAVKWYALAANHGFAIAQYNLGNCFYKGIGTEQDYTQATKWYLRAAEQGHAGAQHNLGYCYSHGQGVPLDYEQAYQWYLKSAEQGYPRAQCNVGNCYYKSRGVPQDYAQAFSWYSKAAQKGYARAEYKLGLCYYFGRGVAENKTEAMLLMEKSADQGYQDAIKFINDHK